jgi:DNA-directed RNA polymerase subunit alpha
MSNRDIESIIDSLWEESAHGTTREDVTRIWNAAIEYAAKAVYVQKTESKPDEPEEGPHYLDFSVWDFEFSSRANSILEREGIRTAKQLCSMTHVELRKFGGLGKKTLKEIIEVVEARGLDFGMNL